MGIPGGGAPAAGPAGLEGGGAAGGPELPAYNRAITFYTWRNINVTTNLKNAGSTKR